MPEAPYTPGRRAVADRAAERGGRRCSARRSLARADYADAHYMLGTVLKQQGQMRTRRFASSAKRSASTRSRRGLHFARTDADRRARRRGRGGRVCAAPQRLNKIKADSQAAVFAVNAGRERLAEGELAGAIAKFREAVGLRPNNAQAHYQLGLALRRQRRAAEARAEFDSRAPPGAVSAVPPRHPRDR